MTQDEYYQAMTDTMKSILETLKSQTTLQTLKNIEINTSKTLEDNKKTQEMVKSADTTSFKLPSFLVNKLPITSQNFPPMALASVGATATYTIPSSSTYSGKTITVRKDLSDKIFAYLTHGTGKETVINYWLGVLSNDSNARKFLGIE